MPLVNLIYIGEEEDKLVLSLTLQRVPCVGEKVYVGFEYVVLEVRTVIDVLKDDPVIYEVKLSEARPPF